TAPALHVAHTVFQNAIEQRLPFLRRSRRIARTQLHHGVLHHVERIGFVTQRDLCDPERLALYARQKRFECARTILGRISQMGLPGRDEISRLSSKTSKRSHATASIRRRYPTQQHNGAETRSVDTGAAEAFGPRNHPLGAQRAELLEI